MNTTQKFLRMILFSTLITGLFLSAAGGRSLTARAAAQDQPNYGIADVDGIISPGEWDLTVDFFANMHRAAQAHKEVEAKLYLRYDCSTYTMFALVLPVGGLEIIVDEAPTDPADAYIKINGSPQPVVTGYSGDDDVPPDFAWIGMNGTRAQGWEASFAMPEGSYTVGINAHTNVFNDDEQQTAGVPGRGIPLDLLCFDSGDLPTGYSLTLAADNGPRHKIGSLRLGSLIDGDNDGQESLNAQGDDMDGKDDEDGVARTTVEGWVPLATVNLNVSMNGGEGFLVAWFDWNNNQDLNDPGEMVSFGSVANGMNILSLQIPASYTSGNPLFARFRLYAAEPVTLSPGGLADGGEVEDYYWEFSPTAVHLAAFSAQAVNENTLRTLSLAVTIALVGIVFVIRQRVRQAPNIPSHRLPWSRAAGYRAVARARR